MKSTSMLACTTMAVVALGGVAACGSSGTSSSSSTTTSSKTAVCNAAADLKQSVQSLAAPSTLSEGKSGLETAAKKVKSDLDAFVEAAKGGYSKRAADVKSSLSGVETAVGDLGSGNVGNNLQAVGTALASLGSSVSSMGTALTTRCG